MPRLGWKTPRQVLRPSCQRCFGGKSPAGCGSMQLHQTPKTSPSETERDLGGDPWPHWLYNDHFCPKDLKWYQFLDASWVMKDTPIVFLFEVSDFTLSQAISRFGWSLQRTTKLEQPLGSKSHMLRPLRQDPRLAFGWIFQRQVLRVGACSIASLRSHSTGDMRWTRPTTVWTPHSASRR